MHPQIFLEKIVKTSRNKGKLNKDLFNDSFSRWMYLSIMKKEMTNDEKRKSRGQLSKYVIRVNGCLSSYWMTWFDGMTITNTDNGESILSGYVADQCTLLGLLEKVQSLNLTLIAVQKVDPDENAGKQPAK